jgi:HTH-type transcriptional regulator/antitoxin HigA
LEEAMTQIADLHAHWPPIAPVFSIRSEEEYDAAVERLNALIDEIGINQQHPLYGVLDTLGTLVHSYETEHHVIPDASGPGVLEYLMEEHGVSPGDLPDVGPIDAIERYLAGEMELTVEQIRLLARRFHVSPAAFI